MVFHLRSRVSKQPLLGFAVLWTAGALAACSGQENSALPSRPPTSPSISPPGPDVRVTRAYTEFTKAADKAGRGSVDEARKELEPYVTGKYLDVHVAAIQRLHDRGREPWGQVVPHVIDVKVDLDTAVMQDCQDTTQAGLADRSTHKLIPGTTGDSRVHLTSNLKRGRDGRWRLVDLVQLDVPCTPTASPS